MTARFAENADYGVTDRANEVLEHVLEALGLSEDTDYPFVSWMDEQTP